MSAPRRLNGFVVPVRRQGEPAATPPHVPTWAVICLGVLLVVALGFVVAAGSPLLYGFVSAIVIAGVAERMIDARTAPWGEGLLVAEVDARGVLFRSFAGTVWLASGFLIAVIVASVLFIGVLLTPGLDLPVWFGAFAVLLGAGLVYGVRLVGRGVRRIDIRLDADGVTAVRRFVASVTVPWESVIAAYPAGRSILLATTQAGVEWPAAQLHADPQVVADAITRGAESHPRDTAAAVALVEDMLARLPRP